MTLFLLVGTGAICALGMLTVRLTEDKIFGLYVIYNVFSGIWCVAFGIPLGIYIGELSTTLLPMMLYYAGRGFDKVYASKYYRYFIFSAFFLIALTLALFFCAPGLYSEAYGDIWAGFSSVSESFGERSEAWIAAVNNMVNFWIGDGLGSHGLKAAEYQYYIVTNGGLVKLYSEMGLVGASMIIFVLALVYIKSFRIQQIPGRNEDDPSEGKTEAGRPAVSKRKFGLVVWELVIITAAILMSVVVNLLDMVIFAPIIYFALGRAVRLLNDNEEGDGA